jgi:hypothetical protein
MPLFLPFEMPGEFLQPDLLPERYAEILSCKMPSEVLEYYTTFTIRTGKPEVIQPSGKAIQVFKNEPDC